MNVLLQKSKNAKPFCTHIDKVKPYIADNLPRNWLDNESNDVIVSPPQGTLQTADEQERGDKTESVEADKDRRRRQLAVGQVDDVEANDNAIAGVPPSNYKTPRPRRHARLPARFR